MYQKILNLIYSQGLNESQQQIETEIPKRSQKLSQMISLINMNEFFQYSEKLIQDATIIINEFSNDNIDIYIQDESILKISGFFNIFINQKSFQIVLNFSFFLNYPQQIFNISIENKSIDDKEVKLSSFFHSSQGEKWISLNNYLTESKLWLNHQNVKRVIQEAKELLTNHFPYHKQKQQQKYFSNELFQMNQQKQADQKDEDKQINKNVEIDQHGKYIVNKNKCTSPIPLHSQGIPGTGGLHLKEENQMQVQITKFTIQLMKEHRNDIANLKQQLQSLKLYKQQQEGIQIQIIWLRQKLDFDIELAASLFYMQQQQISLINNTQQKPLDEIMDFDDLSQQLIEVAAKDRACSDCYQFISKKFKKQLLDYTTLYQLNDWDFCNPNNFVDRLPEPFRFINKIIQKDILLEVYSKVFLIEKYRSDPNYEGPLRTLPPQGIFDISNITTISSNSSNLQIAAGDLQGNILVLDMSKKTKICKKEVSSKRINKVCLGIRDGANDEQKNICIIGVISHLDPVVQIYKYKPGENKINQIHFIQVTKNSTVIGELPMDIEISKYSQYILITQYNGNMLIYKIPELKVDQQQTIQATQLSNQNTLLPPLINQKQLPTKEQQKQSIPSNSQNDVTVTEIIEPFYQIKFQGLKKEQKFNEIINSFKEQNLPKEVEVKEDKKKQQANTQPQKKQETVQQIKEELGLEENNNLLIIKHQSKDGYDISEEYPLQKFKPYFGFLHETINVQQGSKAFDKYKQYEVVVGIVVGWSNTTKLELHYFNQPKKNNLPQYLISQLTQDQDIKFQLPIIMKRNETRQIEIPLIYPLSCLAISKNFSLLGLGLQQGSILIYDLIFQQERFYLDKHQTIVSHIEFCENERLVSCSYDGSVHIYNTVEGTTLCKRTNQFRKGTKINYEEQKQGFWRIISLSVSSSGIAVVQDAESEVRLYDVWRGEKIAKLSPVQVMDDQKRKWSDQKVILKCFRNEILISAQVTSQEQQNIQDQILTTVQIFKIFDSLVNLFPSLSNVYRKGVEKEKILNLFEKIPKQELWNAQFEVPNLNVSHQNVALKVPGQDSKTRTGSQILHNQSQHSQPKLNQSKTSQQKLKEGVKDSQAANLQQDVYENRSASLVGSLHKSVHSDKFDYNSSFRSTNSPQNNLNPHKTQKINSAQIGLTKEMLHPEEHLLEKSESQPAQLIFENSSMVEHCRLRNSEKQLRSEKVTQSLLKLGQKLALEDEKMKLQIRYRQLQKAK